MGEAESEKVPGGITVTLTVVVVLTLPEEPVMVAVAVASVAPLLAVNVKVVPVLELPGLKDAVTPLGKPETEKLTVALKPLSGLTTTEVLAEPPCGTFKLLAVVDSVKVGFEPGQLFTRFAAFTVPMPVAKSHPAVAG